MTSIRQRTIGGPGTFALTLLLIVPALMAFGAAAGLSHQFGFPESALWLIYSGSIYLGYLGVTVAAVLTVVEAFKREIALAFIWLMGTCVVIGLFLLWLAPHIYRNPWYS
jgi:hypothetical protein